jgi:hypothetical protein
MDRWPSFLWTYNLVTNHYIQDPTCADTITKQTQSTEGSAAPELAAAVDELLDQLQNKFDNVSTEVFGKCMLLTFLFFSFFLSPFFYAKRVRDDCFCSRRHGATTR